MENPNCNCNQSYARMTDTRSNSIHPTCGTDLRRFTKVAAMIDCILCGFSIFCGIAVLNTLFTGVKDAETSAFPVGSMVLYILLMMIEIYLAFRLYRAAHERDVQRLRTGRKASGAILFLSTLFVLIIKHTISYTTNIPEQTGSPYPLLWFFVIYFIAAVFRTYMFWIVHVFIAEFEI